jgi:hypothetical protein
MNKAQALDIVLEYFGQPDYDQVQFLKQKLSESGRPPEVFIRYILDAFKNIQDRLQAELNKHGAHNNITDVAIPLWHIAPGKFEPGPSIAVSQLSDYFIGIEQFTNEFFEYIIYKGKTYRYPFNKSEIPAHMRFDVFEWFAIRYKEKLVFSDADLKQWENDYRFFLDTRPDLRNLFLAKGIELGEIHLRHCQQHEANDLHQIDSLQRRIDAAKKLAGFGRSKEQAKPKHQLSKAKQDALYLYYTGEVLKKKDTLWRYWNDWRKDDYRHQSNHQLKTYNTKKMHMEAVKMQVLKEKPQGWKKTADEIQADIEKLTENYKRKPQL